jgi:hypothetical protein
MESFREYYFKSLLTESPHIVFTTSDGYEHMFDMHFEIENSKKDMSFVMKRELLLKRISDIIHSMDREAVEMFWNNLRDYPNIELLLRKVYQIDFAKLYSLVSG